MDDGSMVQLLHANARTTEAIRREIYNSKESIAKAAKRSNVNPKAITRWRKRKDTNDLPTGPKKIRSTVLSESEEKAIALFRKMTEHPWRFKHLCKLDLVRWGVDTSFYNSISFLPMFRLSILLANEIIFFNLFAAI